MPITLSSSCMLLILPSESLTEFNCSYLINSDFTWNYVRHGVTYHYFLLINHWFLMTPEIGRKEGKKSSLNWRPDLNTWIFCNRGNSIKRHSRTRSLYQTRLWILLVIQELEKIQQNTSPNIFTFPPIHYSWTGAFILLILLKVWSEVTQNQNEY